MEKTYDRNLIVYFVSKLMNFLLLLLKIKMAGSILEHNWLHVAFILNRIRDYN